MSSQAAVCEHGTPGCTDRGEKHWCHPRMPEHLASASNPLGHNPGDRGGWCTPKWLADMIGHWDLDPCSNPRSHVVAGTKYMLERGEDGLAHENAIHGFLVDKTRVYINPPYENGSVARWFEAYKHTNWCFLLRFDPSTKWFEPIYRAAEVVAVPLGRRVNFEPPPGVKASSNAIAHALYYKRAQDVTPAVFAACAWWRPNDSTDSLESLSGAVVERNVAIEMARTAHTALADLAHHAGRSCGDPQERAALAQAHAVLRAAGYPPSPDYERYRAAYEAWEAKKR